MKQTIISFHKAEDDDWVADLKRDHIQHVRHDPPWQLRSWVTSVEGRKSMLSKILYCKKCERNESLK